MISPKITQGYARIVLFGLAASYACWRFALAAPVAALAWGALNQLGLNMMIVSLNRRAADARGAVMGLNSAVTYAAVFAGPVAMGPIYAGWGFAAATAFGAALVAAAASVSAKAM